MRIEIEFWLNSKHTIGIDPKKQAKCNCVFLVFSESIFIRFLDFDAN